MRNLRGPALVAVVLAMCGLGAGPALAAESDYLSGKTAAWKRVRTTGFSDVPNLLTVTARGRFVAIDVLDAGQGALPSTSNDGRRWEAGDGNGFPPGVGFTDLSAGSKGLIASGNVGDGEQQTVAFWRSRNGEQWTQLVADPAAFGAPGDTVGVNGVVQGPKGYVGVGYKIDDDGALNATVWTSKNGSAWTQAPASGALDEGVPSERAFVMNDVTYAHKTFVAVGLDRTVNAAGKLDEEPAVWTSPDARTWTRRSRGVASPAGFGADSGGARQLGLSRVVPTDDGFAAAGNQEHSERDYNMGGFAFFSKNGKKWTQARADGKPFAYPPTSEREVAVRYATPAGGGAVIAGILRRAEGDATAKIWTSEDGRDWKSLKGKLVKGYVEGPVAGNDDGALVLGYPSGTDGSPTLAWIGGKP